MNWIRAIRALSYGGFLELFSVIVTQKVQKARRSDRYKRTLDLVSSMHGKSICATPPDPLSPKLQADRLDGSCLQDL